MNENIFWELICLLVVFWDYNIYVYQYVYTIIIQTLLFSRMSYFLKKKKRKMKDKNRDETQTYLAVDSKFREFLQSIFPTQLSLF